MRNLKRALSLALASIMLVGMMAVGTSAASYPDVDSNDNVEAIAVLQAAGVMTGDDKGNFNPDQKVTRNEMAVVMANLLDLDVADFAGASEFTDVPAWAKNYVDACFANGIVSGASATNYNGAASVTAVEAGLMVMKALGYFEFSVDFGDNWKLATIKQASLIDLFDGINAGADTALTRNEVAQLVLNALESVVVVGYQNGNTTSITAGDVSIKVEGKSTYVEQENEIFYNGDEADEAEYLIEKLYGEKFVVGAAHNEMGLPGTAWTNTEAKADEQEIVFIAKDAKYTVVSESTGKTTKEVFVAQVDKNFSGTVTLKAGARPGYGDVVYYYANGKNFDAYVVDYELYKVEGISTKVTKQDKEDGIASYITLTGSIVVADKDFADFDYAKNDYILAVVKDGKVLASELAETVEGKVASKNAKGLYEIGGVFYDATIEVALKDEFGWILNKAGQICAKYDLDKTTESSNYAAIYSIVDTGAGKSVNADGIEVSGTTELTAYVVLADGTKASYVMEKETAKKYSATEAGKTIFEVVAYSITKDGELKVETAKNTVAEKADITIEKDAKTIKNSAIYVNSKTNFVFFELNEKNKIVVSTAAGAQVLAEVPAIVISEKGEAILVFVNDTEETVADETVYYGVAQNADKTESYDDDYTWYTYTGIYGAEDGMKVETKTEWTIAKGDIFSYTIDENGFAVKKAAYSETVKVEYVGEDFYTIGGKYYTVDGKTVLETVIYDEKTGTNTVETVSVVDADAEDLVKDAEIIIVKATSKNVIEKAYIIETVKGK